MEKAEIADLHKALGKEVLEEPPHELERLEAHELLHPSLSIGIGESDRAPLVGAITRGFDDE